MTEIDRLLDIMARLRDPESGCPWDRAQSFETIVPYTIEEAYEVAEAIRQRDMAALADELGDLLFQVVFYAQMAREAGAFSFADVARGIADKMLRRHPHVFGDAEVASAAEQTHSWEALKAEERAARTNGEARASALEGVARALPALSRAAKLQRRAARVGFDWADAREVLAKMREEIDELEAELDRAPAGDEARARLAEEVGDLLFASANLARHGEVDPETALRAANDKFERRFRRIEVWLAERGTRPEDCSLEEMDRLWERAKAEEHR